MTRSLSLALALSVMVALAAAPAHAYVRESSNWNPGALPVTYYVNQSTIPSSLGTSAGVGAVDGGFTTWSGPSCTTWRATDAGNTTSSASSRDGRNVILWVSGSWPAELGDVSSVIGVTTPVWTVGGYFNDADIRFNNVGFRWTTTGSGGSVDAQSIATHEEGHFLGLDHSPTGAAIMYASYSGGLKRTLNADDQNGVCAIYPSGVAPTDAGMPMGSDPCNAHGTTCDSCTPYAGCGFCTSSGMCVSGTASGPSSGSCSGYVWLPSDCSASMPGMDAGTPGTSRFGDPCSSPTDCGSGGLCVSDGTSAFCSRVCTDDCGCPDGYQCYDTSDPTLSVCGPVSSGRMCGMGGTDAGTPGVDAAVVPGEDAAVVPGEDAAVVPGEDAGMVTPMDDGGGVMAMDDAGDPRSGRHGAACACRAAGAGGRSSGGGALFGVGLAGLVIARRRALRPRRA